MGCDDAADLQRNQAGAHEQREQEHAIRQQLRRHREEEEASLRAALVLHARVAQRHDEALEEEGAAKEEPVDELWLRVSFPLCETSVAKVPRYPKRQGPGVD